jgi:hypothetical protein
VNKRNSVFEVVPKLGYDPMREYRRDLKAIRLEERTKAGV